MLLLIVILREVLGAGVTTHLTYVARVAPKKYDSYHPWLKAGAFFPDSLYSCKPGQRFHDFAEATHWPPFLISGLELWKELYGNIPSKRHCQDSIQLQAFLVGVFTHQIVDSSWHSLVDGFRSHGLLRVLAETEFGGQLDDAHEFLDTLGEFIGLSNVFNDITDSSWKYFVDTNWSLPREQDMMELLARNGLSGDQITYKEIGACVSRGLSASVSETYVMLSRRYEMLSVARKISPASRDFMQEYWLGGEFDLIAMLHKCLPMYQNMFDTNSIRKDLAEHLQLCGNLPSVIGSEIDLRGALEVFTEKDVSIVRPTVSLSNFGHSIALGKFEADGKLYMAVSAPLQNSEGRIYLTPFDEKSFESELTILTKPFSPMRGSTIHTFSINNFQFLVVSEPGSSSLHFYRNSMLYLTISDEENPNAHQLQLHRVADVDGDGECDLLLSGPSYGDTETGCAFVVSGRILRNYLHQGSKNPISLSLSSLNPIKLAGNPYNLPYQHFGAALEASRTLLQGGFLYVTCQSLGAVFVYPLIGLQSLSKPKYLLTGDGLVLLGESPKTDLDVDSSTTHGMFGKTMLSWAYNGVNYLAISQHLFNSVYIYRERGGMVDFLIKIKLEDKKERVAWNIGFGTALTYDDQSQVLWVSAPGSLGNKGAIWKVKIQDMLDAREIWKLTIFYMNSANNLEVVNPQTDAKGFSNFGKVLQIGPRNSLIIGAPQYGYGDLDHRQLTGAIIVKS